MAKGKKTGAEKMLTVREVANMIGAGLSSVRKWAIAGRFPGAKLEESPAGSYWLIPESALVGFEKREVGRPPKPKAAAASKKRKGQ